jgi:hypothetical protein
MPDGADGELDRYRGAPVTWKITGDSDGIEELADPSRLLFLATSPRCLP